MRTGVVVAIALAAALVSCKKSPTAPSIPAASIVGTWHATRLEQVSRQNPSLRVDLVPKGTTLIVVFDSVMCTWTFNDPGQPPFVRHVWHDGGFPIRNLLVGDTLTLYGGGSYYDFHGQRLLTGR